VRVGFRSMWNCW